MVRVSVPAGTANGTTSTTTVTATMGVLSDTATDVTTVGRLLTYADTTYTNVETQFVPGNTVYARATSLTANRDHYFVWKDQSGAIRYTSPDITSSSGGIATNSYAIAATDPVGRWTIEVHRASNDALISTTAFDVSYIARYRRSMRPTRRQSAR